MAVTFTGAGTATAASGAGQAVTTDTSFAIGDYLVALMSYDNSGGGGADPMTGTISVAPATGAVGASVSAQTGLNDPGAASAGLAARCVCFPVTTAIPTSTVVTVSWTGTVTVRAVALMKVSSAGITDYRANSGATGTNQVASAAPALTTPSVNNTEGVLCWAAYEYGAAPGADADTTNGTWSARYGAFTGSTTSGQSAHFQSKIVTATATQAFNPTGTTSDWILGALIFRETPLPSITQATYRFYDDADPGGEPLAAPLADQDTPVIGNLTNGDGYGQIRIRLQSTTAVAVLANDDFRLQWEKNASGTWMDVPLEIPVTEYLGPSTILFDLNTSAGDVQAIGQSFTGDGGVLASMEFGLSKSGTPTGTLVAKLYAHTGTFGSTGIPTGSVLETSATVDVSTLPTSTQIFTKFTFGGSRTLTNGTAYVAVIEIAGSAVSPNTVNIKGVSTVGTHPGNRIVSVDGVWTAAPVSQYQDLLFRVNKRTSPVPTVVLGYDSPTLTEGQVTTNRLTGGTGTFTAGKVSEVGHVTNIAWTGNNYTEVLYSVKLIAAQLANGDTLRFRVVRNGSTTGMTYSATPTVNIVATYAYDETNRNVDITSTIESTDQLDLKELSLTVSATATVTVTDALPIPIVQEGFRWRNDDGDEDAATWKVAQDTNASLNLGEKARLRVLLDTTAEVESITPVLRYKKTTDSTWLPVPVGSGGGSPVYIAASTNIAASGEATTALLTPPAGKSTSSFTTGRMWDDENGIDIIELAPASYPRPTSISGRKVLDQEGNVFLMKNFSSWAMVNHLSNAEITTALESLAGNGFNSAMVWIGGTQDWGTGWHTYTNKAGQSFWTGTPWASALGPAWASVDHFVTECDRLSMIAVLSFCGGNGTNGCGDDWEGVTDANMEAAGEAIATRYLSYDNIQWHIMLDDNQAVASTRGSRIENLFKGINDIEGISHRPVRWMEVNNGNTTQSQGWMGTTHFNCNINCIYSYGSDSAVQFETGYAQLTVPTGDCEPPYDGSPHYGGNVGQQLRERSYAVFIEGGCLINYGHEDWWPFGAAGIFSEGLTWPNVQAHSHTVQQSYVWALIDAYCADPTWGPAAVIDNGATGEGTGDTKAAQGASSTAALVYFPTSRVVTVDTTIIAGTGNVRLRWYDPTTGTFPTTIAASEAQQTGRSVAYPSAHGDGTNDWVLVVDQA